MTSPQRPRSRDDFEIALICALRKESDALLALFDGQWRNHGGEFGKLGGDHNIYRTGWIGCHNVVLVQLPGMGNINAASVAGAILLSFPRIRLSLVVGICGGVPGRAKQEMILGDVVISTQIVHLDVASRYSDILTVKEIHKDQFGSPNREILAFLEQIQGKENVGRLQEETARYARVLVQSEPEDYQYPGAHDDILYASGYRHKHQEPSECDVCAACQKDDDPVCDAALQATCVQLHCDASQLVVRQRLRSFIESEHEGIHRREESNRPSVHTTPQPLIHFGPVGSSNWVIKS